MKKSIQEYYGILEELKLSGNEEAENASRSKLTSTHHSGVNVIVRKHAGSQALLRRGDLEKHHWHRIIQRSVDSIKHKPEGHYLTFSKEYQQGIISQWLPHEKRMHIVTVLPKGASAAKEGTQKNIVENIQF